MKIKNTFLSLELQALIYGVILQQKEINDELLSSKIISKIEDYLEHIECELNIPKKYLQKQNVKNKELI